MKVGWTRVDVNVAGRSPARDHARMPFLRRTFAPILLAVALVLGACGGGEGAPATPATATATEASTGTPLSSTSPATAVATPSEPVASTYHVPTDELPVVRFTRAAGGTVDLPVEVPPASEYGIGLSGRDHLEGRGMVFYYPDVSGGPGFWMRNTHIDLDIAFVDGDRRVIAIRQMQAESQEIHHPGSAYLAGIEAPAGWYAANGLVEGDTAEFLFDPLDYLE